MGDGTQQIAWIVALQGAGARLVGPGGAACPENSV